MTGRPTLVVVSGPPGSGKTTLAHALARTVGCPAICRDEIKEGMVQARTGFAPEPGDELTRRALPTFIGVLELLLRAGVSTVAEAAFQDRVWRPALERLDPLARLRIVHCRVDARIAWQRISRRQADPVRRAHADTELAGEAAYAARHHGFERVSIAAPAIEVDTTDGYAPELAAIAAFVTAPG